MRLYNGFVKVDCVEVSSRAFEVVRVSDSVAFLIYNPHAPEGGEVIFCSQSRAPMISDGNPTGTIIEVPAGRFDHNIGVRELVAQEASEEVNCEISPGQVEVLNGGEPLALSPGVLTEKMYLAFVKLEPGQIGLSEEGGLAEEGERITRKRIPVRDLPGMTFRDMKTFALVQWFLRRRGE